MSASNCVTSSPSGSVRSTSSAACAARWTARGEGGAGELAPVDADALGERDQVRRQVGPVATPWRRRSAAVIRTVEDLPLVPTTWTEAKARSGRAQRGHQPAHAVQPEAHPEQLEARAGGPRRAPGSTPRSQRLQLRAQAGQLLALGLHDLGRGAGTKPSLASLPSARAISPSSSARALVAAALGRARGRTRRRRARATAPPGMATVATGSPAVRRASSRRARSATSCEDLVVALRDHPGGQVGARRRPRRGRASRAAPARRRSPGRRAPRRPRRATRGSKPTASWPASRPSASGRNDQISSVTNGISGCATWSVSREDVQQGRRDVVRSSTSGRSRGLTSSRYQSHSSP